MHGLTGSVLIIEDDVMVARAIRRTLAGAGIQAEIVGTVGAAVVRLTSGGFDVVLADLGLPDGSGWDLLDLSRQVLPNVPVVLMSGAANPDLRARAFADGAHAVLYKPFTAVDLLDIIHACLLQSLLGAQVTRVAS